MTTVTPAVATALSANPYVMVRFVTFTFPGYTARLWTGIGPKVYDGNTYTGTGNLGTIGPITDDVSLVAQRLQLTLSGVDASLMAECMDYLHQGTPVTILEAMMDQDGAITADPYSVFAGEIDTMYGTLGETLTITVIVDNFISFIFRGPDGHRRTAADQEAIFSGDVGLAFAAKLILDIPWGVAGGSIGTAGAAAGGAADGGYTGGYDS